MAALASLAQSACTRAAPADGTMLPVGVTLTPSFCEEFNGDRLDVGRWATAFKHPPAAGRTILDRNLWASGEREVYFDSGFLGLGIDPFRVAAGVLTISAMPLAPAALAKVQATVAALPAQFGNTTLKDVRYSSGMIASHGSFGQTYGYFAMRAKWSGGKGVWPGFWLLPDDDSWPPEIDILEAHGDKPTTLFQSIHSHPVPALTRTVTVANEQQDFHVYGVLWTPTTIDYYVDGAKTASIPTPSDMTKRMHLIATLTIGGYWSGYPDAATKFPATLQIDWIRAWQLGKESVPPHTGC